MALFAASRVGNRTTKVSSNSKDLRFSSLCHGNITLTKKLDISSHLQYRVTSNVSDKSCKDGRLGGVVPLAVGIAH